MLPAYDNNKLILITERRSEFDVKTGVDRLSTPYDYHSFMHYSSYAFTAEGGVTIETTDPTMQDVIGRQKFFSELDKLQIKLMYDDLCNGMHCHVSMRVQTVNQCKEILNLKFVF